MRYFAILLPVLVVGCAAMDADTQQEFENARDLATHRPGEAMRRLTAVVEKHPEAVEVRFARAQAFEAMDDWENAAEDWAFVVNMRASKTEEELAEAHRGFMRCVGEMLGDLPHSVERPPEGSRRDLIVAAQNSCTALLETFPGDRDALMMKSSCLYRLGLYHRARPLVKTIVDGNPRDDAARYLLNLVREQEVGVHERAILEFCDLVKSDDTSVSGQAATHLIGLLDHAAVKESQKDNIRGILLRMVRTSGNAPSVVMNWARRYDGEESQRLKSRRVRRQLKEVDTARALNDWRRAWRILNEMPQQNPEVMRKRAEIVETWTRELLAEGSDYVDQGNLRDAERVVVSLENLPTASLSAQARSSRSRFLLAVQAAVARKEAEARFSDARNAIDRGSADEALAILDDLEKAGDPALQKTIDLLRAQALVQRGDLPSALEIFDSVDTIEDPKLKRTHGILLARAGRAEEAIPILQHLPMNLMDAEALLALVTALEREGNWEAILGRLVSQKPLTDEYQSIYDRACEEAAKKRIRAFNYQGAVVLLRSYVDSDRLVQPTINRVYLEALLTAGELSAARSLLFSESNLQAETLPENLIVLAVKKLEQKLTTAQKFQLLSSLHGTEDGQVDEWLGKLWPVYGAYLPAEGTYTLRYRSYAMNGAGNPAEPSYNTVSMTWDDDGFVVTGKSMPEERWWMENDVWHRRTEVGKMLIPIRPSDDGNSDQEYELGNTSWTAEVVEAGNKVEIEGNRFSGCVRVRLIPNGETEESIYLDIAPRIGEVRREVFRDGNLQFVKELVRFSSIEQQQ